MFPTWSTLEKMDKEKKKNVFTFWLQFFVLFFCFFVLSSFFLFFFFSVNSSFRRLWRL